MLTAADAEVVRRDPALPGLAAILDPDRVADLMRPLLPEREIGTGRIGWIRYKAKESCRAAYRFETPGGEIEIALHACLPEDLAGRRGNGNGNGAKRFVLEELALIATIFPDDPDLVGLAPLAQAEERPEVLRALLPDRPDMWQGELRRLRYRAERRFTAELRSGNRRVLVKSYTRRGFNRARANNWVFRSQGALRVARLVGSSEPHRLLAFEWLPGRMLREIFEEADGGSVALTGAALAELHAQNPGALAPWTREAELDDLRTVRSEVAFLAPGLARRSAKVGAQLAKRLKATAARPGAMHGDFTAFQVLVHDGVAGIIDLDLSCCGDVTDDLGNFLAQLERMGLNGTMTRDQVARIGAAFLDGYSGAAGDLPGDVRLYTALQLFRRARFPFRARDPHWPERMAALIDRSEEILSPRAATIARPDRSPSVHEADEHANLITGATDREEPP